MKTTSTLLYVHLLMMTLQVLKLLKDLFFIRPFRLYSDHIELAPILPIIRLTLAATFWPHRATKSCTYTINGKMKLLHDYYQVFH